MENLTKAGVFENINFSIKAGEIVGFAGLVGAGRTEVMSAIFGMDSYDSGKISLKGKPLECRKNTVRS